MKKILLILIFMSAMLARGQDIYQDQDVQWPMPEAQWSYCLSSSPDNGYIASFSYTRDTIINGIEWQVIERLDFSEEPMPVLITRYSNDSVYHIANGTKQFLFSFTTNLDDEYDIMRFAGNAFTTGLPSDTACTSEIHLKVVNKGELVYNSTTLTTWDIQDVEFNTLYNYSEPLIYNLVERIGVINNFHFINPNEFSRTCGLISEVVTFKLIEYSDSSFVYQSDEECTGVNVSENDEQSAMRVYPNPSRGTFQVDCPSCSSETTVKIYSHLGQLLQERIIDNKILNVNLGGLPNGLYFIIVQDQINNPSIKEIFKILKNE